MGIVSLRPIIRQAFITTADEDILYYYLLAKTQQKNGPGPVVVGWRPCEPLNNPTLLSLGGGSHLKRESYPFPIGLVFWGDWAFSRGVRRSAVLRLPRHNKRP